MTRDVPGSEDWVPQTLGKFQRTSTNQTNPLDSLALDLAKALVRATSESVDAEIDLWLERIGLALGIDRSTIAEFDPVTGSARFTHGWARDRNAVLDQSLDVDALLPWTKRKMLAGQTVVMPSPEKLPEEAIVDRKSFQRFGPKSNVMVPIKVGGMVIGAISFAALHSERSWDPKIVRELQAIAEVLGYGLERRRTDAELLRLRSELIHVTRVTMMGQLAASIAHELNQPLTTILRSAEALQSMLASRQSDVERLKAGIADIIDDDNRAKEIIVRLRSLFRRGPVANSTIDVAELLSETGRIVQAEALIRQISLIIEVPSPSPTLLGDRIQLQLALINLIMNALDAAIEMETGTREVRVGATRCADDSVCIFVRDFGRGVAAEDLFRIFNSFFTTKAIGIGLGLATAKSIVESHGGLLLASPNSDRGTTFEMRFPVSAQNPPVLP